MSTRDAQDARETIKDYAIWGGVATAVGIGVLTLGGQAVWWLLGGLCVAVGQFFVLVAAIGYGVALGTRASAAVISGEEAPRNRRTPW